MFFSKKETGCRNTPTYLKSKTSLFIVGFGLFMDLILYSEEESIEA